MALRCCPQPAPHPSQHRSAMRARAACTRRWCRTAASMRWLLPQDFWAAVQPPPPRRALPWTGLRWRPATASLTSRLAPPPGRQRARPTAASQSIWQTGRPLRATTPGECRAAAGRGLALAFVSCRQSLLRFLPLNAAVFCCGLGPLLPRIYSISVTASALLDQRYCLSAPPLTAFSICAHAFSLPLQQRHHYCLAAAGWHHRHADQGQAAERPQHHLHGAHGR